jgi:hypothetical protein
MDQHVPRAITIGLRLRGVDVITAYEDGASAFDDAHLLERASALDRVLFSQDDELLAEAVKRRRAGMPFSGLVYGHQMRASIGECIRDLDLISKAAEPDELRNLIQFLPM